MIVDELGSMDWGDPGGDMASVSYEWTYSKSSDQKLFMELKEKGLDEATAIETMRTLGITPMSDELNQFNFPATLSFFEGERKQKKKTLPYYFKKRRF